MIETLSGKLEKFQNLVGIRFQLYNSLFLALPFFGIDKTGILLSLFNSDCEDGFAAGRSPSEIIDEFFAEKSVDEKIGLLFRFVQYAERQVVLFDALEDAAFSELNDPQGARTITQLVNSVLQNDKSHEFKAKLDNFSVRLVLTAHPTQFYPGSVLGIINDLEKAITGNNVGEINTLLQQLGRTPFFKKQKPTPLDEAMSLIWYLENVFYQAIGGIAAEIRSAFPDQDAKIARLVKMGFWSGGDRDGNPFVTCATTLQVAEALKRAILRSYHADVRRLKRRLTFANVEAFVTELEAKLYQEAYETTSASLTKSAILDHLAEIRSAMITDHNGLFAHLVEDLINKVEIFGLHFAALDIRQEASEHGRVLEEITEKTDSLPKNYAKLTDNEKIEALIDVVNSVPADAVTDELSRDTLQTIAAIKTIQQQNGVEGCERYIISQCQSAVHVMEVFGLFLLGGWQRGDLNVDIVPLFETISDLERAPEIMRSLFGLPTYREHLTRRRNRQTIMLGFSDGTKDGGYL
ncbi:MAG: phosphoenolpyruvate carboxylase, partial [Pyrinomonadaceae bacterium]